MRPPFDKLDNLDIAPMEKGAFSPKEFLERYAEHYWEIMKKRHCSKNEEKLYYDAAVNLKLKEFFEHSNLWYRISRGTLKEVLKSENPPFFKTVHETGTTGGPNWTDEQSIKVYQEERRQLEFDYLGCPQNMNPAETPLSVYIADYPVVYHAGFASIEQYGSIAIRFKNELKERTFGILADSYSLVAGARQKDTSPDLPFWVPDCVKAFLQGDPTAREFGIRQEIGPKLAELELHTPSDLKLYALPTPLNQPTRDCWPMKKWYPLAGRSEGFFMPNWDNPCELLSNQLGSPYAEGLIDRRKGPVTISDIEEVVFICPERVDEELKTLLSKRGLSYRPLEESYRASGSFLNEYF